MTIKIVRLSLINSLDNSKKKQFFYSNLKNKSLSFNYVNIDSKSSLIKSYKNNLLSHSVIEKRRYKFLYFK